MHVAIICAPDSLIRATSADASVNPKPRAPSSKTTSPPYLLIAAFWPSRHCFDCAAEYASSAYLWTPSCLPTIGRYANVSAHVKQM